MAGLNVPEAPDGNPLTLNVVTSVKLKKVLYVKSKTALSGEQTSTLDVTAIIANSDYCNVKFVEFTA